MRRFNRLISSAVLVVLGGAALSPVVLGEDLSTHVASRLESASAFDIASQPLDKALLEFSRQANLQVMLVGGLGLNERTAPAVRGTITARQALTALLENSGFAYTSIQDGTVTIKKIAARALSSNGAGSIRLAQASAVPEQDARKQDGAAAGQDPAIEEIIVRGTYNYTGSATVGGKTVQSLREIPQSISVVTRQRLDDQNLNSLPDALRYTTGVTVGQLDGAGTFNIFYARGYPADSYLLDGLNVRTDTNMVDLDLAIFDRIEVMRGPAGLFQGAGEPGLTVSLARKRALAPFGVRTMLSGGSWNAYRGELDVTGAMTDSGRVRGRAVAVYDDRDSFLDGVSSKKQLIYGTTEFDLGTGSTLSVGGTYQDVQAVINQGLPAFPDRLLDVARSTSIIADWNLQDMQTADVFANLESRLGGGRLLRVVVRRQERDMYYASLRPNNITNVDGTIGIQHRLNQTGKTDNLADVFFSSPFSLAGREHGFLIGADYRDSDADLASGSAPNKISNVYSHDPHAFAEPVWNMDPASSTREEEYGVYSQVRLNPTERFKVQLGGRLSWWQSRTENLLTGGGALTSVYDTTSEFTPYAGAVFDITATLSLYASYSDIFKPQNLFTVDGRQLEPRVGYQYEAGLKGEFRDGQLNASLAVFRLIDENRGIPDPSDINFFVAAGKIRSQGAEVELNGNLTANWSIAAGYAYNEARYLKDEPLLQGLNYNTLVPQHSVSAWTHYIFRDGVLSGLEMGAGMRAVSSFSTFALQGGPHLESKYTVFSGQIGYRLSERHKLSLNIENLLDKKYYERLNSPFRQNYYGIPRSATLTLRSQF